MPGQGRSKLADAVQDALAHRGPDAKGWFTATGTEVRYGHEWTSPPIEPEVLLLHRRLSIIDTSEGGWQPMSTPDHRYHIVYNGELYNYLEVRQELERAGQVLHSQSDTEVLLRAYAYWGPQALRRFVGMFAFAIFDSFERTVTLARDFFGIKPLYVWKQDGCLCFGSEIKALFAFGLKNPHANVERVLHYLRDGVTDFGSETLLREVRQIPAAHYQVIHLDGCREEVPVRFWNSTTDRELEISFDEAACQVRDLFMRSMQLHLRSDVAIGSALSGGIDSSAIVMAVRHLDSDAEIHAFSFIPDEAALSEEKWIQIVSQQARAEVHRVSAKEGEIEQDLMAMMDFHDEPFGSTSAYAQYLVFRAARDAGVKVMLDGQGADEILGGYQNYKGARLGSLLRQQKWIEAASFLGSMRREDGVSALKCVGFCGDFLLPPQLQTMVRGLIGKDAFPSWLDRGWFEERGVTSGYSNYTPSKHVLRSSLSRSVSETLPGLLRYEDRNSMISSVESRVPFLTPELAILLGSLPENYLIDEKGTSKAVFRAAMRGIVPDAILDRRDKVGFATPEKIWLELLAGWVRSVMSSESAREMKFLKLDEALAEIEAIRRGTRPFGFHVWRWVNLIRWSERLGVLYE